METETFHRILGERVLLLDGAMGTMIQCRGLSEADYRGDRFSGYPVRLTGCNDLLCLTSPDVIRAIHKEYIVAGADIISTDTFNANSVSLEDYGLGDVGGLVYEINRVGAALARQAVAESGRKDVFVAGSIGPTNRTASISPDVSDPSARAIDYDRLYEAYREQVEGLVDGGADILLFETVFDTLNLKAGLDAASSVMDGKGKRLPVMVSATVSDKAGRILSGQTIRAFVASIENYDNVVSIGLNCSFGPVEILPYIREIGECTRHYVSCHPNAGLPDELGEYKETPEIFAGHVARILDNGYVNIIGGCCGTTPAHIAALAEIVGKAPVHRRTECRPALRVSGLECLEILPENNFVNVGERCNVAGSRRFLRLIKEGNHAEAMSVAARQVADGAMMIDVNMDDAMLDAEKEMVGFLRYISSDPDIARVPVMVDSSDWKVLESALKNLQGKSVVNSISLKEGEEAFVARARRIRGLGAAVIVMAFDEEGQADTFERKIAVCDRAYRLLTGKCGFSPDDIIFDVNVMAVATGISAHRFYGLDFIRAVAWIKENLPGARTSGGISNLSFAFRGKNSLREAMHAVFLYHAIKAGLDMGIVNPSSTVTYEDIDPELRGLLEDVILARREEAGEELAAYAAGEAVIAPTGAETAPARDMSLGVGERLEEAIVKGKPDYLAEDLDIALAEYESPVAIIDGPLMKGMNRVGELFGEGKMFLPQVVRTARIMKMAVDHLRPHLEKGMTGKAKAGKAVFATVKGDVHDIGKNIVSIVLACNNYEVIDLGVMVPAEEIVSVALRERPDFVCLSGLITPSLAEMVNVARAMREAGLEIPLIVGGAATSRLHTALKIAPEYGGPVVHASDAAQEPAIASGLLNPDTRDSYIASLRTAQKSMRREYESGHRRLVPVDEARRRGMARNRGGYHSPAPRHPAGVEKTMELSLDDIMPYVNWKMFFHAWGIHGDFLRGFPYDGCEGCRAAWLSGVEGKDRDKAAEALRLYDDGRRMLAEIRTDGRFDGKATVAFYRAYSDGDNIVAGGVTFPLLRQQAEGSGFLCLSDFVAGEGDGCDYIGAFAVTAGNRLEDYAQSLKSEGDEYRSLLVRTLSDRLAEAASEWLHVYVRRGLWGYAPDEDITPEAALRGEYQGIRPAMGYPAIPDQLLNHNLGHLVTFENIGARLTENGAMSPSSTVCGFYISNPQAVYFMTGDIGDDQIDDYARRRGLGEDRIREILRK